MKGGYLQGQLHLPKHAGDLRIVLSTVADKPMVLEEEIRRTHPDLENVHPTILFIIRKGKGNRYVLLREGAAKTVDVLKTDDGQRDHPEPQKLETGALHHQQMRQGQKFHHGGRRVKVRRHPAAGQGGRDVHVGAGHDPSPRARPGGAQHGHLNTKD